VTGEVKDGSEMTVGEDTPKILGKGSSAKLHFGFSHDMRMSQLGVENKDPLSNSTHIHLLGCTLISMCKKQGFDVEPLFEAMRKQVSGVITIGN
jgi:hypothetical protein